MLYILECGDLGTWKIPALLWLHGVPFRVVSLRRADKLRSATDVSGLIIGGKGFALTKENTRHYTPTLAFLTSVRYPTLGICFGHQLLGLLHGSKVQHGEAIRGKETVHTRTKDALFAGIPNPTPFRENHHDFVSLPNEFLLLADSKHCTNEAMRHKNKPLYGVQFHPERSGVHGTRLLLNFAHMCRTV